MKWILVSSILLSFSIQEARSFNEIDEAWDEISDPKIMSYYFRKNFNELPKEGSVTDKKRYWSGDYWALKYGNINYRWFARKKIGFNHNSPGRDRVRAMSIPELAELSPTEKYDLFTGRYDYPLREEVNRIADPGAEIWEGICHGWSPATMNHNEPLPKLMMNPDGIDIPFGSSDIKALLSYYYAHGFRAPDTHQVGRRCYKGSLMNNDRDCSDDLNAGAFHIILANRIGVDGKSFVADLQRYKEVWNHPVTSFKSVITSQNGPMSTSAPGTLKTVNLRTVITYVDENGHDWHPVIGTSKQHYKSMTYDYQLDLDSSGNIIGGEWISMLRPDFLWLMSRPRAFEGTLNRLGELLNDD